VLHRATKKALGTRWIAILPVVPHLINRLLSSAVASAPSQSSGMSIVTYRMMQKKKWVCEVHNVHQRQRIENVLMVDADAPFGDHLGPPVQFKAFFGQNPDISLEAMVSTETYMAMQAAHPPIITCT